MYPNDKELKSVIHDYLDRRVAEIIEKKIEEHLMKNIELKIENEVKSRLTEMIARMGRLV